MTPDERRAALETVAAEVRRCTLCPLHVGRTNAVPGEGHPDTEVVFVGEGPGFNEDREGRPFVGAAGGVLNEMIAAVGWKREEVFITNVVKCRPPGNRDPEPTEIAACAPYLRRQLAALDPALVVTLGRFSLGTFQPGERIGAAHGTLRPVDAATGARAAMTYAMYHPAAALRQGNLRETMLVDMADVPDALLTARARRGQADEPAVSAPALVEHFPPEPMPVPAPEPVTAAEIAAGRPAPRQPGPAGDESLPLAGLTVPAMAAADDQMELFR